MMWNTPHWGGPLARVGLTMPPSGKCPTYQPRPRVGPAKEQGHEPETVWESCPPRHPEVLVTRMSKHGVGGQFRWPQGFLLGVQSKANPSFQLCPLSSRGLLRLCGSGKPSLDSSHTHSVPSQKALRWARSVFSSLGGS
jgi:hypothetical protein